MIFAIVLIGFLSLVQAGDIILSHFGKAKTSKDIDALLAETLQDYGSSLEFNLGDTFPRREDGSLILSNDPGLHQVATILEKAKQAVSYIDMFTYSVNLKSTFKAATYAIKMVTKSNLSPF